MKKEKSQQREKKSDNFLFSASHVFHFSLLHNSFSLAFDVDSKTWKIHNLILNVLLHIAASKAAMCKMSKSAETKSFFTFYGASYAPAFERQEEQLSFSQEKERRVENVKMFVVVFFSSKIASSHRRKKNWKSKKISLSSPTRSLSRLLCDTHIFIFDIESVIQF